MQEGLRQGRCPSQYFYGDGALDLGSTGQRVGRGFVMHRVCTRKSIFVSGVFVCF